MLLRVLPYVFLSLSASTFGATPIYFSFITSFGRSGYNASDIIPGVDLALEHINNRPDILPGYELGYVSVQDSEVSAASMNYYKLWNAIGFA